MRVERRGVALHTQEGQMSAQEMARKILETVDGYLSGRMSRSEFDARQRSAWDEVDAAGLRAEVARMLFPRPCNLHVRECA
jgi:hypothetical protein